MADDIKGIAENEPTKASNDELLPKDLETVSGGLNPQPLPPRHGFYSVG